MHPGCRNTSDSFIGSGQAENLNLSTLHNLLSQQAKLLERPLIGPNLFLYELRAQQIRDLIAGTTETSIESVQHDQNPVQRAGWGDRESSVSSGDRWQGSLRRPKLVRIRSRSC